MCVCVQVDDATVVEMVSVLEKYPITRATLEVSLIFDLHKTCDYEYVMSVCCCQCHCGKFRKTFNFKLAFSLTLC